jgi:plasmid rolling circle replication initiator protein Rep
MDIKGKVHEVGATMQVTDSLKKRELIVEYVENPQYPEYLKFETIQDKCNLLDNIKVQKELL